MTPLEALQELDALLTEEEQALLQAKVKEIGLLGSRKAQLLSLLEECAEQMPLENGEVALLRRVREGAERNFFLLRHLRACLSLVNAEDPTPKTYGQDGRRRALGTGGVTLAQI